MKKKVLALILCAMMAATAVVGGTLAYFTDTDAAKNVMVTGNVSIIQNEQQRVADNDNANLEVFKNEKPLYPITGDTTGDGMIDTGYKDDILGDKFTDQTGVERTITSPENTPGGTTKMFLNANNVVDKIITVTNNGGNDAYVRTLLAFEIPTVEYAKTIYAPAIADNVKLVEEGILPEADLIDVDKDGLPDWVGTLNKNYVDVVNMSHFLYTVFHSGDADKGYELPVDEDGNYIIIEVDGVAYLVTEYYYREDSLLNKNETSHPSLKQIYMSALATNEDAQVLVGADNYYNILALSQGAQTLGFKDAREALNTAFGKVAEVENATLVEWFKECK